MAFSATNLSVMSIGSGKLLIATVADGASSITDSWASSIPDIQTIIPIITMPAISNGTAPELAVSFTASSGTIHIYRGTTSAFTLLIVTGFAEDLTW